MPYINAWRAKDSGVVLLLQSPVIKVFRKYAQLSPNATESGGILLGYVREPHLEILEATEPTLWDRRLKYFFERGWHGHRTIAEQKWHESKGLIRYLGEWHTHPEDYPKPSYTDRTEWLMLARKRNDKRPVLAVIVGRKALHVELMHSSGQSIILYEAD